MELAKLKMDTVALSLSQQEIWLEHVTWPNSTHLNIGVYLKLETLIDQERLKQAIKLLIHQNDGLQMVISDVSSQILTPPAEVPLTIPKLASTGEHSVRHWFYQWTAESVERFELPPFEFALIQTEQQYSYIGLRCLHSTLDGWSVADCIRKLAYLYSSQDNPLLTQTIPSYQDYIEQSIKYLDSKQYDKDSDFWSSYLTDIPDRLLSEKYPTQNQIADVHVDRLLWPLSSSQLLEDLAQDLNKTKSNCLLAAICLYFLNCYNRTSICIGVPVLNRGGKKFKHTLGTCVGVLPLIIRINQESTFKSVVDDISTQLASLYRHSKYPLSHSIRKLNQSANAPSRLFDIIFSFEDFDLTPAWDGTSPSEGKQLFSGSSRTPLAISYCDFTSKNNIEMVIEGNQKYFSDTETRQLNNNLLRLLDLVTKQPEALITDFDFTSFSTDYLNLPNTNVTTSEYPSSIFESILDCPTSHLNKPAIFWQNNELTYQQLIDCAFVLAEELDRKGIKKGDYVACSFNKGPEMIMAMLATSILGAAFIPVDPELPANRLSQIQQQAGFCFVLYNYEKNQKQLASATNILIDIEALLVNASQQKVVKEVNIDLTLPAYAIFTSGTTGLPKGVVVSHQALSDKIYNIADMWQVTDNDISLQSTQFHFDPALIELLVPLVKFGSVRFPQGNRPLPEELLSDIIKYRATIMALVPSTLKQLTKEIVTSNVEQVSLRVCCCGGEVLPKEVARQFITATNSALYNVYGPTEATIFVTAWKISQQGIANYYALPVGKPMNNTNIFILSPNYQEQPVGVEGSIYIGGTTLSSGYVNNPEQTNDSFKHLPHISEHKLYHTGDIGWLDHEGNLHFKERSDRQIKLRGYRIELADIEANILNLKGVDEAAVKLVSAQGIDQVHAWVSFNNNTPKTTNLRNELAKLVPDYMLPTSFYVVDNIPKTSNQKIDYNKLDASLGKQVTNKRTKPSNRIEKTLLQMWQQALKKPNLAIDDNFFENGADSLTSVIMLTKIEAEFNVSLPLHKVLESSCVMDLAQTIISEIGLATSLIKLNQSESSNHLFIAASGHGDALRFKALANELDGYCHLYMLQPPKELHIETVNALAELYVDQIKNLKCDNVHVGGFSVGGIVALETARLLKLAGIKVKNLFIVDTILIKFPFIGLLIWQLLNKTFRTYPRLSAKVFTQKFISVVLDSGLYMQVKAMRAHKIQTYSGKATILKSTALKTLQKVAYSKWRNIISSSIDEYKIETTHGKFFESGRVEKLANILKKKIED